MVGWWRSSPALLGRGRSTSGDFECRSCLHDGWWGCLWVRLHLVVIDLTEKEGGIIHILDKWEHSQCAPVTAIGDVTAARNSEVCQGPWSKN